MFFNKKQKNISMTSRNHQATDIDRQYPIGNGKTATHAPQVCTLTW